jgi:hypothetical protein
MPFTFVRKGKKKSTKRAYKSKEMLEFDNKENLPFSIDDPEHQLDIHYLS